MEIMTKVFYAEVIKQDGTTVVTPIFKDAKELEDYIRLQIPDSKKCNNFRKYVAKV